MWFVNYREMYRLLKKDNNITIRTLTLEHKIKQPEYHNQNVQLDFDCRDNYVHVNVRQTELHNT